MSTFISTRAKISKKCIIGNNTKIYGDVVIEDGTIIEGNVVIGHPVQTDIKHQEFSDKTLDEFYDSICNGNVVIKSNSIIRSNSIITAVQLSRGQNHVIDD